MMIAPSRDSLRRARAAKRAAEKLSERFGEPVEAADLLPEEDIPSLEHLDELDRFNDDPQHRRH